MKYILDHWQGRQDLAWSFWVNLVALRLLLFAAQHALAPGEESDYHAQALPVLMAVFLLNGPLFVWQVVGVLRAGEVHLRDTGAQASVWGSQLAIVLLLFLTISYSVQAWQFTQPFVKVESHLVRMDREHASRYRLETDDGILRFTGSIELGSTRRVKALLEEDSSIRLVILESDGGNVYEGRGLAELFRTRALATRVESFCSSACTLAFSGGRQRSMAPDARIGFHQYRMDTIYLQIVSDPRREQERDLERFREAGFGEAFLAKVFTSRPQEMWFPDREELLAAGVVQSISAELP